MNQYRSAFIVLSFAALGTGCLTASNVIGVASTRGTMDVNGAAVRGTADVADGASVQTNQTPGSIHLGNGVQVTLGENSAASVYNDRLSLTQGASQVTAKQKYAVEALGFRIDAPENGAARVAWDGKRILVTAFGSPVTVSQEGVLLALLNPGTTYFFEDAPQDNTAASAGKVAGNAGEGNSGNGAPNTAKGLSTHAKWGIAAGAAAAAGTGIGLGLYLSGNNASR